MEEIRIFSGRASGPARLVWAGSRPCARPRVAAAAALGALLVAAPAVWAQPATPPDPADQAPPSTGTDMEIDPDAAPPEPPEPEEPPPLPPAPEGTWGVGGKEEAGRFVPTGKTGALKEEPEDPEDTKPVQLGPPGEVFVDTVIGFGDIRDVVNDADRTGATSVSLVPGLSYRFGEIWTVAARMPFSNASITGPQAGPGDDYSTWAVGNLAIEVRLSFPLTRRLRLPVSVTFYAPTAPGDALAGLEDNVSRAESLVNQAAMAARGWEEQALFAPSRIGIAPSVGMTYDRGSLHGALETRLEVMARSGGSEPVPVEGQPLPELRDPATNWVTGGSLFYDFLDAKLSPGLRAWLALSTAPIAAGTRDYSGPQLVVEPSVHHTLPLDADGSLQLRAALGFLIPVGGHLGGADGATMNGLRIRAALAF